MSDTTPELRVGDSQRKAADEQLQAAVGDGAITLAEYDERSALLWQARTRSEVDALVADLPSLHPHAVFAPPPASRPGRRVIALMSEDRLSGVVLPGQEVSGYAVMGKAVVDLRREDLPSGTRVRVRAVMGEVEVQVPPGTHVELSGMAVMGDRKVRVAPGEGPVVHVDAYAVMGSVVVSVGDGQVVRATPGVLPVQRRPHPHPHAPLPHVPPPHRGALSRARRRIGAGLVPLALLAGAVGVVASGTDGRVVFGSTTVEAVDPSDRDVHVSVLFGSVTVVVPDDAVVEQDGLVVFGSVDCEQACDGDGAGEVISVRSLGGFGSVEIVTESEAAEDSR